MQLFFSPNITSSPFSNIEYILHIFKKNVSLTGMCMHVYIQKITHYFGAAGNNSTLNFVLKLARKTL